MSYLFYSLFSLFLVTSAFAQNLTCNVAAQPPLVREEGLTERTGDIELTCAGGTPSAQIMGNLTLFLSVNITNRLAAGNTVTGVIFTADNGSGPQTITAPGVLTAPSTLVYNNATFTLSSTGTVALRIANLRAAANQSSAFPSGQIGVLLSFASSAPKVFFSGNQLTVATPQVGLYDGFSSKIICAQGGSPLAKNPASFASFISAGSVYNSTRVTEGFAAAFDPRSGFQGLNADTGTRFIVNYSGFPAGARLFVPTVVAGSDAVQPTAGGDFGPPAAGGQYAPGGGGSLLLSLVQFASPTGAGGAPYYTPGAPNSGTVSFDQVNEIPLTNGAGYAVYEVMDADPFVQESAQFPTFLALTPFSGSSVTTSETVTFAPVSTVATATATDPIPRFVASTPPPDCNLVGDCGARYFPALTVVESSIQVSAQAGSNPQAAYVQVQNHSSGVLSWTATVTYQTGSGWISLSPSSGVNNGSIQLIITPGTLSAGTYQATLTIDAGPIAGTRQIPITLTITTPASSSSVSSVLNAATLSPGPLAPGSLATIMGSQFSGSSLNVTFNGTPAKILFSNNTQINLLVPASLGSQPSAQLNVQVNGISTSPQTVALSPFAPGIFTNGILNQDYSVNGTSHPAAPGTVIQIFATGLSGTGVITAQVAGQTVNQPYYAGAAPGLMGVQQVDLILPQSVQGDSVAVSVCGGATADKVTCSPAIQVAVSQPE